MNKKIEYALNMVVDYFELQCRTTMYKIKETADFFIKYKEGCAIVAGVTIIAGVASALISNSDE